MVDDAPRAVRVPGPRRHQTIHRPRLRRAVGPTAQARPDPGEPSACLRALREGSARRDWPRRWAASADARRRAYFAHHALRRHERVAPLWTGADGPLVEHALDTNGCGPTATEPAGAGRSASGAAGSPASRTRVTRSSASSSGYSSPQLAG